ncbi:MAG: UbiX family flavin prenyltransferase [Phycisphaerae bacterium]
MSRPNSGRPKRKSDPAAPPLVVGVTGASGAPYAVRLVERAVRAGREVWLIVSRAGRLVLADEAGMGGTPEAPDLASLWPAEVLEHVTYVPAERVDAPPASGSFGAAAAVVVPCSMNTLATLARGQSQHLVHRAAQVALKEGRPLVVVPREMPVTPIDLENMARLARAGAVVMPAMPAFYHRPETVADLVDFVVAKVLDRLGIPHDLATAWPGAAPSEPPA